MFFSCVIRSFPCIWLFCKVFFFTLVSCKPWVCRLRNLFYLSFCYSKIPFIRCQSYFSKKVIVWDFVLSFRLSSCWQQLRVKERLRKASKSLWHSIVSLLSSLRLFFHRIQEWVPSSAHAMDLSDFIKHLHSYSRSGNVLISIQRVGNLLSRVKSRRQGLEWNLYLCVSPSFVNFRSELFHPPILKSTWVLHVLLKLHPDRLHVWCDSIVILPVSEYI